MKSSIKTYTKNSLLFKVYRYLDGQRRMRRLNRQFNHWTSQDQRRLEFYRQFIQVEDIVFDVGANLGNRAKIFSRLGASVVAVEPQTACANFLSSVFHDATNFHLVRKALGASPGQAEMMISSASTISSLSPEWVRSVKESGRFAKYDWNRKETVTVDTLDNLISEFGRPSFVKIDVEGFEDQVVSGLSQPVGAISMEFTPEYISGTMRCIQHLRGIGNFQYQISLGESMDFALPNWCSAEDIGQALAGVSTDSFGDLYAKYQG